MSLLSYIDTALIKDIAIRAVKTAVQTFIASVGVGLVTDVATLKAAALAAGAAAVSVIMNAVLAWSQSE
jgi:hypothetical protein